MLGLHTVDGRNPAPPKKPWNDDSPVNTNTQWFPMVSKWCRISSIHSRFPPGFPQTAIDFPLASHTRSLASSVHPFARSGGALRRSARAPLGFSPDGVPGLGHRPNGGRTGFPSPPCWAWFKGSSTGIHRVRIPLF